MQNPLLVFRRLAPGLLLVAAVTAAGARSLNVPAAYTTIQAAIDAAANGDVVIVAAGTYRECLNFKGKAITVRSSSPADASVIAATIIDANSAGSAVTFASGETAAAVLRGFTITGGSGTSASSGDSGTYVVGGGVLCTGGAAPTLIRNVITGNSAQAGAGVMCLQSSPTLTSNTISSNTASEVAGGVFAFNHSAPVLTGNVITANSADEGGGVFCDESSSPTLTSNTISGNSASGCGGALACENSSSPALTNNVLSNNLAGDDGGALFCSKQANPTIVNNTFYGNSALSAGGTIYCESNSAPVLRNTIVANTVAGGGICVDSSTPVVTYCCFYSNGGGNYGNWTDQTGKSGNISKNPLFRDPTHGDFHEKSTGGTWNPKTKSWLVCTATSPCLDAGAPKNSYRYEPTPNGGRINMGAYGNTRYASKAAAAGVGGTLAVAASAAPGRSGSAAVTVNLSAAAAVEVTIANLAGRPVAVLPQRTLGGGVTTLLWSGQSLLGTRPPAGRYLVRVEACGSDGTRRRALAGLWLER